MTQRSAAWPDGIDPCQRGAFAETTCVSLGHGSARMEPGAEVCAYGAQVLERAAAAAPVRSCDVDDDGVPELYVRDAGPPDFERGEDAFRTPTEAEMLRAGYVKLTPQRRSALRDALEVFTELGVRGTYVAKVAAPYVTDAVVLRAMVGEDV